jgi:hypothetical protein
MHIIYLNIAAIQNFNSFCISPIRDEMELGN